MWNRRWIDKSVSVVAISSYLQKHFESRGIDTVRIPVILDIQNTACEKRTCEDKTVFVYAGAPGKKDYLKTIIKGFALIPPELKGLIQSCDADLQDLNIIAENIKCLGRVAREKVLENLSEADFTVLLRSEEQRYAKAGFPTKVVESLAIATPVISNLTSDLGMYLRDGNNAMIVSDCSPEAFADSIKRALMLSFEERRSMQRNARQTAEEHFDHRQYEEILKRFIEA